MWLLFGFCSAVLLGLYDVSKKISVQNNAVIPVLFLSIVISSVLLSPFLLLSRLSPDCLAGTAVFVPHVDMRTHLFISLKSLIVLTSWIFSYFGLKHLPITLASPVAATRPAWTVVGALLIFGEDLNIYQLIGIVIALSSFFMFSVAGKKEGISFATNKWFWFLILATLTGAISGLYDKYLMRQFDHMAVQVYYTFYQALIMSAVTLLLWFPKRKETTPFQFRWSIVLISVFLISSDFFYFYALTFPDALISVLSIVRRFGVVVAFLYGVIVLRDKNVKAKAFCLLGVLVGMIFLFF